MRLFEIATLLLAGTGLSTCSADSLSDEEAVANYDAWCDYERYYDDAALDAAAADLAPLEDHFVAVAGGSFLGGAMLLEDAARLFEEGAADAAHAYFFVQGSQGERRVPIPALYGPRVAGNGLLQALGLSLSFDPGSGILALRRGDRVRTFETGGGAAVATFTVGPASGLLGSVDLEFVVTTGFAGTALVSAWDAAAAGLCLSEIPGEATLAESMTGRTIPCRRALARVTLAGFDDDPDLRASALVEVLFPR